MRTGIVLPTTVPGVTREQILAWAQAAGSATVATAASVVGPGLVRRYGPVIVPEGSPQETWLARLEEVRDEATRRYVELQDRAAAALNG